MLRAKQGRSRRLPSPYFPPVWRDCSRWFGGGSQPAVQVQREPVSALFEVGDLHLGIGFRRRGRREQAVRTRGWHKRPSPPPCATRCSRSNAFQPSREARESERESFLHAWRQIPYRLKGRIVATELLTLNDCGLYCAHGDFYIDPWRSVDRAIITHAHSDHARWGMKRYLCSKEGERVLRLRLGPEMRIDTVEFGEAVHIGGVRVSLHPAGHVLGSSQVRLEHRGEIAVVTGDYKTEADRTCTPFE